MTKKDDKNPWGSVKGKPVGKKKEDAPWGNSGDRSSRSRSGRGSGSMNAGGGDIDDILRQAQDRVQALVPGPQNKSGFVILFIALVGIWMFSGFYRVLPEEHGVIMTFGKWTDTKTAPGLGYLFPWPFQSVKKVNVTFERRIEIGFRERPASRRGGPIVGGIGTDVPDESLMVTGDENIIDIDFVVLWRISDAGKYLFEIRNPEKTIKKVAESAMRQVVGRTAIQSALTGSRAMIQSQTRELMQNMMDAYDSGVAINEIQLQQVNPPQPVVEAFDDVLRAQADKERLQNEADAYRNKIIPEARGASEQLLQQAEAYKQKTINGASGDAQRFISVYDAYVLAKDVTTKRMYIETMQEIMSSSKKVIIGGENSTGVLPYLPLGELQGRGRR